MVKVHLIYNQADEVYNVADIIDEIQQDIKDERFEKMWKQYGNYVIGFAIAVVLGTAGSVWWQDSTKTKNETQGSTLFAAVMQAQQGEVAGAIDTYSQLKEQGTPVAAAIASLKQASLLAKEGKKEDAMTIYDSVSQNKKAPAELKQLGDLLYVNTAINTTDAAENKQILQRLARLTEKGAPWRYSALELSAFHALGNGDTKRAGEIFKELTNEEAAPVRIRNRANEMINAINS